MGENTQIQWDGQDRRRQIYSQSIPSRIPSWLVVVGTLLVNIVIIWTPLVVLMTNRVAELEAVKVVTQRYIDNKIAERVNTLESDIKAAVLISNKYNEDKIPLRIVELEMQAKQVTLQLADHPHRVTMLENELKRMGEQGLGLGPRVTALEVIAKNLDKSTDGLGPRVLALELDHRIITDDLKGLPNRLLTLEQTVDRHGKIQELNVNKIERLEHSEWVHHKEMSQIHNSYNGGGP